MACGQNNTGLPSSSSQTVGQINLSSLSTLKRDQLKTQVAQAKKGEDSLRASAVTGTETANLLYIYQYDGVYEAQAVNVATNEVKTLVRSTQPIDSISGTADGSRFVLSMRGAQSFDIYELIGGQLIQVTNDSVDDVRLSASTTLGTVAWQRNDPAGQRVRLVQNFTGARQSFDITSTDGTVVSPGVSGDGSAVSLIEVAAGGTSSAVGVYFPGSGAYVDVITKAGSALRDSSVSNYGQRVTWLENAKNVYFYDANGVNNHLVASSNAQMRRPAIDPSGRVVSVAENGTGTYQGYVFNVEDATQQAVGLPQGEHDAYTWSAPAVTRSGTPSQVLKAAGNTVTVGALTLQVPAGAVERDTVIRSETRDLGDIAPQYDFGGVSALKAPVTVSFTVDSTRLPSGMTLADYDVYVNGTLVPNVTRASSSVSFQTATLGTVELASRTPWLETGSGTRNVIVPSTPDETMPQSVTPGQIQAQSFPAGSCADQLQKAINTIKTALREHWSVKLNIAKCKQQPHSLEIVVVNMNKPFKNDLVYRSSTDASKPIQLISLKDLASGASAEAAINGFPWGPEEARGSAYTSVYADKGFWVGTTHARGQVLKVRNDGKPEYMFAMAAPNNLNVQAATFPSSEYTAKTYDSRFNYTLVGSTTSIIRKDGTCNPNLPTTETPDRWSAIGFGNNRIVMVSSRGGRGEVTTTRALCDVFLGLNATSGAIRLDGGSAAGLWFKDRVLNPLAFNNPDRYLVGGGLRQIASAVVFKR